MEEEKVKTFSVRSTDVGDMWSTRAGQKGVVGMVYPDFADMVYPVIEDFADMVYPVTEDFADMIYPVTEDFAEILNNCDRVKEKAT